MPNKLYRIAWGENFSSIKAMIDKMQNPRNPKSIYTIKQYCQAIRIFTYYLKVENPDVALETVKASDVFKIVDGFIDYLAKERKFAPKTICESFYGLKYWLETNNIDIEILQKVVLPKSTIVLTEDRIPTREELHTIMDFANIRDKALIEIAVSSGLRIRTISTLKWKDLTLNPYTLIEQESSEPIPAMIKIEPLTGRKTTKKYFTFITPECKKALIKYKEWRERKGEQITPDSRLIASVYGEGQEKYFKNKQFGDPITTNTIFVIWQRLLAKAGLNKKSYKMNELHFHVLRKYFKTQCVNSGIKSNYIEFWLGHKGEYLDNSYFRATLQNHLMEYQKAIPNLSIYETPTISELDRRKQQVTDLLGLIPLSQEDRELIKLKIQKASTQKELEDVLTETTREKLESIKSHDCQKIISEIELQQWLTQGYRFIAVLPSGKILISNEA
jgi:integrase